MTTQLPTPWSRPPDFRELAELLVQIHGRHRALELVEDAAHGGDGDRQSTELWREISAEIRRRR